MHHDNQTRKKSIIISFHLWIKEEVYRPENLLVEIGVSISRVI